jgi:hypothetical protein
MNKVEKSAYNRAYRIANADRIAANRAARRAGLGDAVRRCSIPGCDGVYDTHGFCGRHYQAWLRNGDPLLVRQTQVHGKTPAERLIERTKRGRGCWEYTNYRNPKGYGTILAEGKMMLAHRLAWELERGPIPKGMNVLHRCDNPACVRVSHLFLGTLAQNNADMRAKGRASGDDRRGAERDNAKLTDNIVKQIRVSKERGVDLARRYGVSQTLISAVRLGRIWKHIK